MQPDMTNISFFSYDNFGYYKRVNSTVLFLSCTKIKSILGQFVHFEGKHWITLLDICLLFFFPNIVIVLGIMELDNFRNRRCKNLSFSFVNLLN